MDDSYTANYGEVPAVPQPQGYFAHSEGISAATLISMIDELDVGMLVCGAGGTLIHANAAGHRELRWGGLLALRPGHQVCATEPAQRQALLNAMAAALGGRRQLLPLRSDDDRLTVAVQPLPAGADVEAAPSVLLLLGRRSVATGLVVEMLCRMHAITGAEQRVLEGLLCGQSAEALAKRFGVKLSTVRTQVTALRTKLGVSRISDALRLAAELPPMSGALRCQRSSLQFGGVEARA